MFHLIEKIDVDCLLNEYNKLEGGLKWSEFATGKQTGLQYRFDADPWFDAVGVWKKTKTTAWTDENYLNPYFENTVFEKLIKKYNLKRTRFLWLKPQSCYTMHVDFTPRIHIPLITNEKCLFLIGDSSPFHLPTGGVYWVDTTKMHTAVNCSTEWRLHLVGASINAGVADSQKP